MTETKLDELDQIVSPGFKLITKNRLSKRNASSGAVALISEKYKVECLLLTTQNNIPFG